MSPKNTVMIGVGVLVLISMSQKSGTMVQGMQTNGVINSQRAELINTGKQQKELGKAESDLAVSRYRGNCRLADQSVDGALARQNFFQEGADAPAFNVGDIICNTLGATGEIIVGPNGTNVVTNPASVSAQDFEKVRKIIQDLEAPFTLQ
jgi:hypothetical protein